MKMMERVMMIIVFFLSRGNYQVRSTDIFSNYPCYSTKNAKIEIENFAEHKFFSYITFLSEDISSTNDVWKPCSRFGAPLTNYTLNQIGVVLNLLSLTKEDNSCNRLNKLVLLRIGKLSVGFEQIGKIVPDNRILCGRNLLSLHIKNSPKSINRVIRNESLCQFRILKVLSLISNDILEIESDAFVCLEELIKINLSLNNLSSLPEGVFSHNPRLQEVILKRNRFKYVSFLWLKPLTNVQLLDLRFNQIEILPNVIPLRRLIGLILRDNNLREIHRNAFSELTEVVNIDLSSNQLTELHAETFRNNAEVITLNLRHNALKSIPEIKNLSKLEELYLSYNNITSINLRDLFNYNNKLTTLFLSHNNIEEIIETSTGKSKPYSQNISKVNVYLNNNRIRSLRYVSLPEGVSRFHVANNQIKTVCVSSLWFTSDSNLNKVLRISENPLECNCVNYKLTSLNYPMIDSDFDNTECDIIPTPLNPVQQPRVTLARLREDEVVCRIEFNLNEQCVCDGNDNCSSNTPNEHCFAYTDLYKSFVIHVCEHLTEIPSGGYYTDSFSRSKHYMYFSGNNIETLKLVHFGDDRISAECVSFSLEKSNVRIIENDAFNQMINLEILSLRGNRIQDLPGHLIRNLTKLKELYLSNNRLTTLTSQTVNRIIKLELHNNSLTHLPFIANTKQLLLLLSSNNLINLSLHDNPWSCECEFIQLFHNYLGNNTHTIQRVKEIKCMDNNEYYNVLQFDLSKCKPFLHLTAIATSTTFAVVIIVISILIFLYRREVRVLLYSRYRVRIFKSEVDDDVSGKQYDAFIAYNNKDEELVVHELMPGLEAIPKPYRLCVHERDFPAGAFIQDSILEAVRLSSRTIVLLSQNFVDSGWCRLEFMTAHAQMLQDRCPRVLLIVLGQIPRTLDPEMELYLRTNTYLRWGEKLFWDKLYYAMPDKRVTTPPTDIMPMQDL